MERTAPATGQTIGHRTAENIRSHLGRQKLSGRDLARAVGWSTTTAWRRLNGDIVLTVDEVAAVSDFLGVPIPDLLGIETPATSISA